MTEDLINVLLIEDSPGDARLVKELLAEVDGTQFRLQRAETLLEGLELLSSSEFEVALVDLSLPDSHGMETFDAIQRHAPGVPVVLLTGLASDDMALQAIERGAQDYLIKGKLSGESLARVLRYAVVRKTNRPETQATQLPLATITGVLGAKGGVGTTTFACHFGLELARQSQTPVLLADLDTGSAGASFLLKADGRHSILDASTNLHRLDSELWKGLISNHSPNLDLIQAPGSVKLGNQLSGERVRHVLRFARRLYRNIVVDLGRFSAVTAGVLPELHRLILLSTPDVQALFEARRILQEMKESGYARDSLHFVLNRKHKRHPAISSAELEKALGCPIYAEVPDCPEEFAEMYGGDRTPGESSTVRRQVSQMVSKLEGYPEVPANPQRFRLFSFARA